MKKTDQKSKKNITSLVTLPMSRQLAARTRRMNLVATKEAPVPRIDQHPGIERVMVGTL
jgi:hypothetical protein